jgi:DNA-binding beta-propeller fold protein YncE
MAVDSACRLSSHSLAKRLEQRQMFQIPRPSITSLFFAAALLAAMPEIRCAPAADPPAENGGVKFLLEWGSNGVEPGEFDAPIGIAISRQDEVFVTDFYNSRVQKFDTSGKLLKVLPVPEFPGGIAIDDDGTLYISHFGAGRANEERKPDQVTVHDADGNLLRQWGRFGTGEGEFDEPGGVALTKDGRLYVADQTNRRMQVFDREGKFLFQWGQYGIEPGQFGGNSNPKSRVGGPQFVAIDSEGDVYTTEASVGRIQRFTADGKFVLQWGQNEDRSGDFGGVFTGFPNVKLQGPVAIIVDPQDRIWVSAVGGRIQQFSKSGEYLRGFGSQGTGPGQFYAPHGIALDSHGDLYVVDGYNHRVQKFDVGAP